MDSDLDDSLIDLTEDDLGPSSAHAPSAISSHWNSNSNSPRTATTCGGSSLYGVKMQQSTPKWNMQQPLSGSKVAPPHRPITHAKAQLQLSSINQTTNTAAASQSTQSTQWNQPYSSSYSSTHTQSSASQNSTISPFGTIARNKSKLKLESTAAAAASASPSQQTVGMANASQNSVQTSISQWASASQPIFTPPSRNVQTTSRAPHTAPARAAVPSASAGYIPAAAASSSSNAAAASSVSHRAGPSAAPASSSSSYVPNADEVLVERKRGLEQQLVDLEAEEQALATKRRTLKAELREVEEKLNRPMQLPFTNRTNPKPAIGGVSALLAGSSYWQQSFPWDDAALETMQGIFGIESYRISQREVINATMDRKDVFVIMPTGAGKSLLYQLPALLNEGVTLVISPLLSLMEDQVINLRAIGIESYMLCGTTSKEDAKHIQAQMLDKHSQMRLLYVTPEKLVKSKQFLSKLERMHDMGKLVRIVIDEVHCCSNWGHDFRPDYAKLNILKIQFPTVPILAVTATATDSVVQDCQKILSIRGCQFFKCSFNRPNLHFGVRPKSGNNAAVAQDMYDYIASIGHLQSTGIIYCYSRKEVEELCKLLSQLGLSCDFYHSDVTPEQRQRVHHRWVANKVRVVVATNAFGLGINKPDVRFVLHHTFPAGISTYYQEAGRAGRDGLKAYCCVWYSARDLSRQSIRVYSKQNMTAHLYPMAAWCHTVDQCRRVVMARHFGESLHSSQCGNMCDICELLNSSTSSDNAAAAVSPPVIVTRDLSEAAVQICEFVVSANTAASAKSGGKRKRASVGTMTQKQLTDECKKRNSSIVLPKDLSRGDCERLIVELLLQGILRESFKNTAYSTISYIQHDPDLLAALRRGDLLIKLNFVPTQNGVKPSKSTTKRRKSKSEGKEDPGDDESSSWMHEDEPMSSHEEDDDFMNEDPIEVELDDEQQPSHEDEEDETRDHRSNRRDTIDISDEISQSSEDTPISLKRFKRGPHQYIADPMLRRQSAPSHTVPPPSAAVAPISDPDDFEIPNSPGVDEDEAAYQAALIESINHQ